MKRRRLVASKRKQSDNQKTNTQYLATKQERREKITENQKRVEKMKQNMG